MGGSRGWRQVVHTPQKYHKKGFLSNTGPDPLKNCKATGPEFNVRPSSGCQQNAIWWYFTGPLLVVFWSSLLSSTKKTLSKSDPLWQKFLDPRMTGMKSINSNNRDPQLLSASVLDLWFKNRYFEKVQWKHFEMFKVRNFLFSAKYWFNLGGQETSRHGCKNVGSDAKHQYKQTKST